MLGGEAGYKGKVNLDKGAKREKLNNERGQGGRGKDEYGTSRGQKEMGKIGRRLNIRQVQGLAFQNTGVARRQEGSSKVETRVGEGIRVDSGGDGNRQPNCRGRTLCKAGLKCFYANARSLRNKKDELFSYIVDEDLDVICITEAWINEEKFKESKKEYEFDGYTMYLNQRTDRIGGGVVVY